MDLIGIRMQVYHQPSEYSYKFLGSRYLLLVTIVDLLAKSSLGTLEQLDALPHGRLHRLEFSTTSKL